MGYLVQPTCGAQPLAAQETLAQHCQLPAGCPQLSCYTGTDMALMCADSWTDRCQRQRIHMVGSAFFTSEQAKVVKLWDAALATGQDGSRWMLCGVLCKVKQLS